MQICILTLEATIILANALSIWQSGAMSLPDKPAVDQFLQDQGSILFGEMRDRIERYLRLQAGGSYGSSMPVKSLISP